MASLDEEKSSSEPITLNVGGKIFVTKRGTLLGETRTRKKDTFFDALLQAEPDFNGAYFIDRDPQYFDAVLSFLRTGAYHVPTGLSHARLQMEMNYFCVNQSLVSHDPTWACPGRPGQIIKVCYYHPFFSLRGEAPFNVKISTKTPFDVVDQLGSFGWIVRAWSANETNDTYVMQMPA